MLSAPYGMRDTDEVYIIDVGVTCEVGCAICVSVTFQPRSSKLRYQYEVDDLHTDYAEMLQEAWYMGELLEVGDLIDLLNGKYVGEDT